MIHWSWAITAFIGGFISYGILSLMAELRGRKQVAEMYRREYMKKNDGEIVNADDFEQELELHKN
ncbi:hypothetical protein [Fodinibius sp. SL11]|uniref:hypothetical protein n=1 Tax=Fodinibius sp. SL11 TaxID=3425690 RepID=UPI003F882EE6